MEIITKNPLTFSPSATKELKRLMNLEENTGKYLRIGVKGGGCSGMSYLLGFEEKADSDSLVEIEGIPCMINPNHLLYLANMEIDWQGGLNSRGFTFSNPNASTSCGCGTSFAV